MEGRAVRPFVLNGLTALPSLVFCLYDGWENAIAHKSLRLKQDELWANAHLWYPAASHHMGYLYEAWDQISDFCHQ